MNKLKDPHRSILQRAIEYPGHLKNWWVWKTGFCRRLRKIEPVFIFQMGKVASKSIQKSLEKAYPGGVIHGHDFSLSYRQGEVQELYRYWHGKNPPERMLLVSLVRNPVDRNVSAFFENFETCTGINPENFTWDAEEILSLFLEKNYHQTPENWFDHNTKKLFGVDVYTKPFPDEGAVCIEHPKTPMLVMRMESSDEVKIRALSNYLSIGPFPIERYNDSSTRDFGSLYKRFKEEVKLPRSYVEEQVSTKYFKHFYPGKEQATFEKWCSPT